jgi:hypothetical protein
MADLCFDAFGISKEKKDTNSIKGNRGTYKPINFICHKESCFHGIFVQVSIAGLLIEQLCFAIFVELPDVLPSKRKREDDSNSSDGSREIAVPDCPLTPNPMISSSVLSMPDCVADLSSAVSGIAWVASPGAGRQCLWLGRRARP